MKRWLSGVLVLLCTVYAVAAAADELDDEEVIFLGADFIPTAGTSSLNPYAVRTLSINLLAGFSGGTRAFEIGGLLNFNDGSVQGGQIAGLINANSGHVKAIQIAGLSNINQSYAEGLHLAGGANFFRSSAGGAQIAGGLNLIASDATGIQIAGGANIVQGDAFGLQIAGGANIVQGDAFGLQIAPINIATGYVGAQIGLINISVSSLASIGLIGIYLDGYSQPEAYLSEDGLLLAGIRHGGFSYVPFTVYHIYSFGTRAFRNLPGAGPALAISLGTGFNMLFGQRVDLSLDLTSNSVINETIHWNWKSYHHFFRTRLTLAVNLTERLAIFGGPTLSFSLPQMTGSAAPADFALFEGRSLSSGTHIWPGLVAGVRLGCFDKESYCPTPASASTRL